MEWGQILTAVAAVIVALGGKEVVERTLKRRDDREDARENRSEKVAELEGTFGIEAVRIAIEETRGQIAALKGDVSELKAENRSLERQVDDLRRTVTEYQRGLRVPMGQVLIPVGEVRNIRENYSGALLQRSYPGEHEEMGGPQSLDVRMYPLPPGGGGRAT